MDQYHPTKSYSQSVTSEADFEKVEHPTSARVQHVVVGLLENEMQQVFVSKRLDHADYAGSLEFPGGKIEADETPRQALVREFEEELGIQVLKCEPLWVTNYQVDQDRVNRLYFFKVTDYFGQPYGREGQETMWLEYSDLDPERFPAGSYDFIQQLTDQYREYECY